MVVFKKSEPISFEPLIGSSVTRERTSPARSAEGVHCWENQRVAGCLVPRSSYTIRYALVRHVGLTQVGLHATPIGTDRSYWRGGASGRPIGSTVACGSRTERSSAASFNLQI